MPLQVPFEIEAGQTFKRVLYYPGVNLTGCTVRTQFRRSATADEVEYEFTSSPAAGWTIGLTTEAITLQDGRVVPAGSGVLSLRIEQSVTRTMSGSYWYATEVEFPIGSNPEPDCEQPTHGPVSVLREVVR